MKKPKPFKCVLQLERRTFELRSVRRTPRFGPHVIIDATGRKSKKPSRVEAACAAE